MAVLSGCNTVYFYETEKVSMTLEARPDPSSPVSGNIGVKQRIAAVIPPTREQAKEAVAAEVAAKPDSPRARLQRQADDLDKHAQELRKEALRDRSAELPDVAARKEGEAQQLELLAQMNRDAAGNALSVMSSFRFHKYPAEKGAGSRVTIDAALVTGHAAITAAANGNVNEVMWSLTGANGLTTPATMSVLSSIYSGLEAMAKGHPGSAAYDRKRALDVIASLIPSKYPIDVYGEQPPSDTIVLEFVGERDKPIKSRKTFRDVIKYDTDLRSSSEALRASAGRLEDKKKVVLPNMAVPVASDQAARVAKDLRQKAEETDAIRREFDRRLQQEPAVPAAIKTFWALSGGSDG